MTMSARHMQRGVAAACGVAALLIASEAVHARLQSQAASQQQQQQQQQPTQSPQAMKVTMDQLDDNPRQYLGMQIVVEAEVQEVLGPRLLTIDEYEWFDFDGDTLVFIHAPFAALVGEDARVTVTGTLQPFVRADIEREWGWFDTNPEIEVEFKDRPVLIATSIKSDQGVELAVRLAPAAQSGSATAAQSGSGTTASPQAGQAPATAGTSGRTAAATGPSLTDLGRLVDANDFRLVGAHVDLKNARVAQTVDMRSFWVTSGQGQERLLVVAADPSAANVANGQMVSIQGVVLQVPDAMRNRLRSNTGSTMDERIYVFASSIGRT
jgi:hypothetical protein